MGISSEDIRSPLRQSNLQDFDIESQGKKRETTYQSSRSTTISQLTTNTKYSVKAGTELASIFPDAVVGNDNGSTNKLTDFLMKTFFYRVLIDFFYTLILSYIVFGKLTGSLEYALINLFAGIAIYFLFINVYERNLPIWFKWTCLGARVSFAAIYLIIKASD